jgi:hypothetical protein
LYVRGRSQSAALSRPVAGLRVKVEIASLDIIAGDARPRVIREALDWAENHRAELSLKWIELNEAE